jgi:hypothetical protein
MYYISACRLKAKGKALGGILKNKFEVCFLNNLAPSFFVFY